MAGATDLTIVVPAFNEERRLARTLAGWFEYLSGQARTAEVIVVDDGSTDGTGAVVEAAARAFQSVRLLRLEQNRGKGAAVRAGVLASRGEYVFYVDADLNIDPRYLDVFMQHLATADIAIGSRSLRRQFQLEGAARMAAGALYQVLRRSLLLPVFRDTQCGFKGFRGEVARAIFSHTLVNTFSFDIEVLFLARKYRARVIEVPVRTVHRSGSTVKLRRHLVPALRDIVVIRVNDWRGRYGGIARD